MQILDKKLLIALTNQIDMIEIFAIVSHENNAIKHWHVKDDWCIFYRFVAKGFQIVSSLLLNFVLGAKLLLTFHFISNNFCWFVLSLRISSYQALEFHIEIRYVILYVLIEIFSFLAYLICLNYHYVLTSSWLTSVPYVSFTYIKALGVEYLLLIILVLCRLKF